MVQSSAGWISQFLFLKINPGRRPALLQPQLHPDQVHPSVCLTVQPFISPSIHTSILSFLQISGILKFTLAWEGRQRSWLQDAGKSLLCRMWKQVKPLPSLDLLGKTYMTVCFFSESFQREVADWRPSDARREGRGRSPSPLPPQQWPSGLHPAHLIALQSSLFKEGSGGRLTVIFSLAHPLPPPLHPKAPAAVLRKDLNQARSLEEATGNVAAAVWGVTCLLLADLFFSMILSGEIILSVLQHLTKK